RLRAGQSRQGARSGPRTRADVVDAPVTVGSLIKHEHDPAGHVAHIGEIAPSLRLDLEGLISQRRAGKDGDHAAAAVRLLAGTEHRKEAEYPCCQPELFRGHAAPQLGYPLGVAVRAVGLRLVFLIASVGM